VKLAPNDGRVQTLSLTRFTDFLEVAQRVGDILNCLFLGDTVRVEINIGASFLVLLEIDVPAMLDRAVVCLACKSRGFNSSPLDDTAPIRQRRFWPTPKTFGLRYTKGHPPCLQYLRGMLTG
jgi:hypothetical protein